MKFGLLTAVCAALLLCARPSAAETEHHRATHLGNPVTRFAPPLSTPDDLRARFRDPKLHPDFVEVLRQWGWTGDLNDFFNAGLTAPISEYEVPVGDTLPFMSSRDDGKAVCLRNVTWAGKEPIHAYTFIFHSKGRIYRCVTPKPCSNFLLIDLGPEPISGLSLDCDAPDKVTMTGKAKICLTVHNTGNITESAATVTLPLPAGTSFVEATDGAEANGGAVTWKLADLRAGASRQVCAVIKTGKPGSLAFNPSVTGATAKTAQSTCGTAVNGVPALLLEKADDPDPVSIGDTTTYTVKVTNQGSADDTQVQVVVTIAPQLVPVASAEGKIEGQIVTLPLVPKLAPKDAVTYKITAKGVTAGDGHTKFTLSSDDLSSPISAEESTTVY